MAVKPKVIKPTLVTPEGINNYSGDVFRCFTKGDTLPFRFTFKASDGTPININGWKMYIVFSSSISCDISGGCEEQVTTIEVEIPIADDENGVFEGEVSDIKTQSLPCGIIYAMAKYVTAAEGTPDNPGSGSTHILDMCRLEVYPNLTFIMR
jgi:hypothetical protein